MRRGEGAFRLDLNDCVSATDAILRALACVASRADLARLMGDLTLDLGFRHFALIHHNDHIALPAR
jgi:hypothetical protein